MLTGRRGRRPLLSAWEGRGERRLASEAQSHDSLLSAGSWTRLRVRWGQATHDVSGARRPRPHAKNSIVVRMTTLSGPVVAKLPREVLHPGVKHDRSQAEGRERDEVHLLARHGRQDQGESTRVHHERDRRVRSYADLGQVPNQPVC